MASPARVDKMITLEEFLRLPEIDEHPYLEYIDGRIEAKVELFSWLTLRRLKSPPPSRPRPSGSGETTR